MLNILAIGYAGNREAEREGGREGEELRTLNIYNTLALLVISLMRSGVCVRMRGAEGDLEQV